MGVSALVSEYMFCDPGSQEVHNLSGGVGRRFYIPAPVEVRDHLAVRLASQPEFADPAAIQPEGWLLFTSDSSDEYHGVDLCGSPITKQLNKRSTQHVNCH